MGSGVSVGLGVWLVAVSGSELGVFFGNLVVWYVGGWCFGWLSRICGFGGAYAVARLFYVDLVVNQSLLCYNSACNSDDNPIP